MKNPRLKECILYDSICTNFRNLALNYSVKGCICLCYNYKIMHEWDYNENYNSGNLWKKEGIAMGTQGALLGPGSFLFLLRSWLQDVHYVINYWT